MSNPGSRLAGKVALGASVALLAVALPSAGLAFGSFDASDNILAREAFIAFTPADADPRLARFVAQRSGDAQMLRFTPAGATNASAARSITVAVRIDQQTADALSIRSAAETGRDDAVRAPGLRVAPTRYNLGLARGYRSFAQAQPASAATTAGLSRRIVRGELPDIASMGSAPSAREEESRFVARIALEEGRRADNSDASGQRLSDQMLDVGGSYSITRNLDINAGVRYEQDRDLAPVPSIDQQDSQAVYIGTQFRF